MVRSNNTHTATCLEAACEQVRLGHAIVPVLHGEKAPSIKGWPNLRLTESELPANFSNGENLGLILGEASGGLVDVDLDSAEARALSSYFLPPTDLVHGRPGKPSSHHWFVARPIARAERFSDLDGYCIVELRSTGQQTLIPPSIHPSGEVFTWEDNREPAVVDGAELSGLVRVLAAGALLARHWPQPGSRNDAANALAGMLLRAGWTEERAADFVAAIGLAASDEETRQRARDVTSTAKRLHAGRTATGAPRLAEIIGQAVVERLHEWLGIRELASQAAASIVQDSVSWPEPLAPEAFHGLAGQIVRAIEPYSEADPAALLVEFLVAFGNVAGCSAHFLVEGRRHYVNLFAVIVGETSKARKGTSWGRIADIFERIDPFFQNRVRGGLASGEGVVHALRDRIFKKNRKGEDELIDDGVGDKRLLLLESEFALPLAVIRRDGNTASEVLRRAWDSDTLETLSKNSAERATGAHLSIIGHTTRADLRRHLGETDIANGFANRFLFICARRSKCLPDGGHVPDQIIAALREQLSSALAFAAEAREMKRDADAAVLWREVYPALSEGGFGLLGSATSRAEAQVLRISMIYALLDSTATIRREHLLAALSIWDYGLASARFVFGDALGDVVADTILAALRANPAGMTRSEIHGLFGRNRPEAEITRGLKTLLDSGLAVFERIETDGRPAERWRAFRGTKETNFTKEGAGKAWSEPVISYFSFIS